MKDNSKQMLRLLERRLDPNDSYYVEKEEFEVVPMRGTKGLRKVENVYLPPSCINLKSIKDMKLRPDDAFICG
jgi:hypothetical protein